MPTRNIHLQFTPYDEQREVLESDARFRVVAAGRRSGKTIMAAFETVHRAAEADGDWRGYWVGAEHQHAKTAFRLIDKVLPDDLVARRNQSPPRTIELSHGPTVEFHTAGGGALVSVGLDWAVCDEAGKDFPERSWTQELRPALSDRDGEAMFISTPDGRGWFYDRWHRGDSPDHPEWQSWRWPSYANPHVDDSEIDAAKADVPDRIFRQEYLAEFIDETGGVFEDLDDRLFTADYDLPLAPADADAPFSIGVDLARHEDFRVIVVVDAAGRVVYFDRAQGEAWPEIQRAVESVAEDYPGLVSIDASRDNKLVADLERSGLRIEPVHFSSQRKQDLVENLIATVEAGDLSAPDIPALRHEMEVFEYDVTRAGNVRYDAPEGFHDDTIDALALAVDGLERAGGAATATASVGGDDRDDGSGGLEAVARRQARERRNATKGWK
jgi:hypothetical protein